MRSACTRLLFLLLLGCLGCRSPYYADRGAAVGGVTGAVVGAAIGEHNDHPLAGAAIGGVAGALAGSAIGDSIDQSAAYSRMEIEQRLGRQVAATANVDDVIAMTKAGLSDQIIINHIRTNGVAQPPRAADLVLLGNEGVSDNVIRAMQTPVRRPTSIPVSRGPIIVEEHHYTVPRPVRPRPYCPPRPVYRRGRTGVHFSFRN